MTKYEFMVFSFTDSWATVQARLDELGQEGWHSAALLDSGVLLLQRVIS